MTRFGIKSFRWTLNLSWRLALLNLWRVNLSIITILVIFSGTFKIIIPLVWIRESVRPPAGSHGLCAIYLTICIIINWLIASSSIWHSWIRHLSIVPILIVFSWTLEVVVSFVIVRESIRPPADSHGLSAIYLTICIIMNWFITSGDIRHFFNLGKSMIMHPFIFKVFWVAYEFMGILRDLTSWIWRWIFLSISLSMSPVIMSTWWKIRIWMSILRHWSSLIWWWVLMSIFIQLRESPIIVNKWWESRVLMRILRHWSSNIRLRVLFLL